MRIDEAPEGAQLYVDAQTAGPAVAGTRIRVTPGMHVIEARSGALVLSHVVIDVAPGQTVPVRLALDVPPPTTTAEPVDAPPSLGDPPPGDPLASAGPSEAAAAVVARHRGEMQHCYERALRDDPSTNDVRIDLDLHVGADGRVTDADASGGARPLEQCIERSARRWTFPASDGATEVELPIVFSRG